MAACAIILALSLAAAIGALVYIARRAELRVDSLLATWNELRAAQVDAGAKTLDAERARFESAQLTKDLAHETARANALEEYIAHDAGSTDPNALLAPDDIGGRVLRVAQRWRLATGATGAAGDVPADARQTVPAAPTASTTATTAVLKPE
jgi:hypothetical protein